MTRVRQLGMSLLEVLVVLTILAVLAGVAVPTYSKSIDYARQVEAIEGLGVLRQSQYRFFAEHSRYTTDIDELDVAGWVGVDLNAIYEYATSGTDRVDSLVVMAMRSLADGRREVLYIAEGGPLISQIEDPGATAGLVIHVGGDAAIQRAGQTDLLRPYVGMWVHLGDQVLSGPTGSIEIAFGPQRAAFGPLARAARSGGLAWAGEDRLDGFDKAIQLKENSRAVIEQIKPTRIDLPQGRIFTVVDAMKPTDGFEIKTPTLVAGARGTGYEVVVDGGGTWVGSYESRVAVRPHKGRRELFITSGSSATVSVGHDEIQVEPVSSGRRQAWLQWVSELDTRLYDWWQSRAGQEAFRPDWIFWGFSVMLTAAVLRVLWSYSGSVRANSSTLTKDFVDSRSAPAAPTYRRRVRPRRPAPPA